MMTRLALLAVILMPVALLAATPEHEPRTLELALAESFGLRLEEGRLVDDGNGSAGRIAQAIKAAGRHELVPGVPLPLAALDRLHDQGEARSGRDLYHLRGLVYVSFAQDQEIPALCAELERLKGVVSARPVPKPIQPPLPPDYTPLQEYFANQDQGPPTAHGVDWARTQPGGDGSGVTICDIEYGWDFHQEVPGTGTPTLNPTGVSPGGFGGAHGTASLGIIVAEDNGWGITGIAPAATGISCASWSGAFIGPGGPFWNVPGAIALATDALEAGDVILLEQQGSIGGEEYVPIEWWNDLLPNQTRNAVVVAMETAVANGIHVVQAAGNGAVDLDQITWVDSGAMVIGAGGVRRNMARLPFSSYGARVDFESWGELVVTAGYGDLYSAEGEDLSYTGNFAGTSSAAAIAAGLVVLASAHAKVVGAEESVTPEVMRDLFRELGRAPLFSTGIGRRPDLERIFPAISALVATEEPKTLLAGWMGTDLSQVGGFVQFLALATGFGGEPLELTLGGLGVSPLSPLGPEPLASYSWQQPLATVPPSQTLFELRQADGESAWPYLVVGK